jgi:MFS family permease/rhodanese-related sulfurtransferase
MSKKRGPLTIIFFTVFLDLVGFGMIIPLNPYLAREYGASALEVGLLLSAYSLMQVLFSPIWGKWSDRVGRRPIILASLMGTGLAHLSFAFSGALWMLFVSRAFSGLFGANISTAMAYAADVTENKDRSKAMGMIGAAFGLGFIFGPFFGGILGDVGISLGTQPPFGHSFPALVAALLCFINTGFAYLKLHESLPPENRKAPAPRESRFKAVLEHYARPVTGSLLSVSFLATFSMAQMEANLFLLVKDKFDMGLTTASLCFAYIGVVIAFTQGYLIRKLLPVLGERKMLVWGTAIGGMGLGLIGVAPTVIMLGVVVTAMALGFGLRTPALNGSISMSCSAREQGAVMGANQSLQAVGRVLGPALGGWVYGAFGGESAFFVSGLCGLAGLIFIFKIYERIPEGKSAEGGGRGPAAPEPAPRPSSPAPSAEPPRPVVIPDRPRPPPRAPETSAVPSSEPQSVEPQRVEHVRKEDRITLISAFQFRSLFTNNVQFLFFDLRPEDAVPQYSRAVKVPVENVLEELQRRTSDKRAPVLFLCEDGVISKEAARQAADAGFINVVVVDGGARALNKTGHV